MLLAKLWDKINAGMRKNIPASTCFLSPRELEMARFLFGEQSGLYAFGGHGDAERKMLVYLPEYLEESALFEEDSPCICLRAVFYEGDSPSHRDFLGALMGAGIGRETVGDICVGKGSCDFFVTADRTVYSAEFHLRRPYETASDPDSFNGSLHSGAGSEGNQRYFGISAVRQHHLFRFSYWKKLSCPVCHHR